MKHAALVAALILTPFIALYWALTAFVCGWIGGWKLVLDEWASE